MNRLLTIFSRPRHPRFQTGPLTGVALFLAPCLFVVITVVAESASAQPTSFNLIEATVPEMQAAINSGLISSEFLVQQYLKRIEAYDRQGPNLASVITLNPLALQTARTLDMERSQTGPRGPLHGIPVLLKDNIDTFDMPTTAGAKILENSVPPDDAFLANRLREAGAIILGKANLSEFANWVSFTLPDGFSAVGGQVRNPYGPETFSPWGSSAGSAVAAAANLAAVTVGTETQGSIISPSLINSVVGIRPTLGLVSRDGIIPIAASQDTAGPITRSVTDAAILLAGLAGVDPSDPATAASEGRAFADYTPFLNRDGLRGKRVGFVRHPGHLIPDFITADRAALAERALGSLRQLGAEVVDDLDMSEQFFAIFEMWGDGLPVVFTHEFVGGIERYLTSLGANAPAKTLADIVAFNAAHPEEAIPFGQGILEASLATGGDLTDSEYLRQLELGVRLMGAEGFDRLMAANNLDALIFSEGWWSSFGAITGYPSISVPSGYDDSGMPTSISFLSGPYTEAKLIEMAYAYEQGTIIRRPPPSAPMIAGDYVGFGDFDADGRLSVTDLDMLIAAVRSGGNPQAFDLTGDSLVNMTDLREYVTSRQRLNSTFGDANLDGQFNSGDLVQVFIGGEYEDGVVGNSKWATGDWNGDGEFGSGDLMFAMQEGGYEGASRPAVNVVPEPSTLLTLGSGVLGVFSVWRKRRLTKRVVS